MTKFSFVTGYSVVDKADNPLVTGDTSQIEDGKTVTDGSNHNEHLHIDLTNLVQAKKSFHLDDEEPGNTKAELTLSQFVDAFASFASPTMREQLSYLFMKIDCNCDGRVSWDELLTYVMSQDRNEHRPQLTESQLVRAEIPDCPSDEAHREPIACSIFAPKAGYYITGGRDGTLRVWTTDLRLHLTMNISEDAKASTTVGTLALLPGHMGKLAVASSDRVISFYELQDSAGSRRWTLWGRMQMQDMPISLVGFKHVADDAHCFAIGTDTGCVPILDAKKLLAMVKDDHLRSEANKNGAIPFKLFGPATILTLSTHTDWVCHLAYEESVGALVSGSLDSLLCVTQLDWPRSAVPSNASGETSLLRADPKHCRSMCTIRAHAKGVAHFQLMSVSSRKLCATCSYDRNACVWNIETGDLMRTLVGHKSLLRQLAYDPASQVLVTLAVDGEMRTWEMISYSQLQTIRPATDLDRISSLSYNPLQQCLVTTTRRLSLWQHPRKTATKEVLSATLLAPKGHRHPVTSVLYSHQFYIVISGDESGLICVWDARSGRQVFRYEYGSRLTAMQLDSSGRKLIIGDANGDVSLWNFSSGEKLRMVSSDEASRQQVEVSALLHIVLPKVNYFVSVGWNRDVWMWPDRREDCGQAHPRRLVGHVEDILCVAYCPPNLLCSGAYDGSIIVHSIESGKIHKRISAPKHASVSGVNGSGGDTADFVRSHAIETLGVIDANRQVLPAAALACGTADGFLRIYSPMEMLLLDEVCACLPGEGVQHLCAEDSSTFLVTGDSSGRVKVWDISELRYRWPSERDFRTAAITRSTCPLSKGTICQLYSWRAHAKAITKVRYLTGIEGIITASSDCTVRLWTLTGEQVGVLGQADPWSLGMRGSWFDSTCHPIEATGDDKVLASERRVEYLLGREPPRTQPTLLAKTPAARPRDKSDFYRLRSDQLEDIHKLGSLLNQPKKQPVEESQSSKNVLDLLPPVRPVEEARRSAALARSISSGILTVGQTNSTMAMGVYRKTTLWQPAPKATLLDARRPQALRKPGPTRTGEQPTRFRKASLV